MRGDPPARLKEGRRTRVRRTSPRCSGPPRPATARRSTGCSRCSTGSCARSPTGSSAARRPSRRSRPPRSSTRPTSSSRPDAGWSARDRSTLLLARRARDAADPGRPGARADARPKRGGGPAPAAISTPSTSPHRGAVGELVALDEALDRLSSRDAEPRAAGRAGASSAGCPSRRSPRCSGGRSARSSATGRRRAPSCFRSSRAQGSRHELRRPGAGPPSRALFDELLDLPSRRARRSAWRRWRTTRAARGRRAPARGRRRRGRPSSSRRALAVARRTARRPRGGARAAAARAAHRPVPDPVARSAAAAWARSAWPSAPTARSSSRSRSSCCAAGMDTDEVLAPLPARAPDPRAPRAPAHRAPARRRRDRRRARLLRHGARRRRADHRLCAATGALALERAAAAVPARSATRCGTRTAAWSCTATSSRRTSWSTADGAGQAARLRHRQAPGSTSRRDAPTATRAEARRLTPAYAAPEQMLRRAGDDGDRRLRARRAALRAADRDACRIAATAGRPPSLAASVDTETIERPSVRVARAPLPSLPAAEPSEPERRRARAASAGRSRQHPADGPAPRARAALRRRRRPRRRPAPAPRGPARRARGRPRSAIARASSCAGNGSRSPRAPSCSLSLVGGLAATVWQARRAEKNAVAADRRGAARGGRQGVPDRPLRGGRPGASLGRIDHRRASCWTRPASGWKRSSPRSPTSRPICSRPSPASTRGWAGWSRRKASRNAPSRSGSGSSRRRRRHRPQPRARSAP